MTPPHSPLPKELDYAEGGAGHAGDCVFGAFKETEECHAVVEEAVRRWNTHSQLVEALEDAICCIDAKEICLCNDANKVVRGKCFDCKTIEKARAALEAAKGGQA